MHGLKAFFEQGLSSSEILEQIRSGENPAWKESLEATRRVFDPAKELERTEERGIELIPWGDLRYPFLLKESSDPPLLLYVKGDLIESDQAAVAIVGTRHPSLYGREQAKRFAGRLAEMGLTIVSGFARGIDREAHEAALGIRYGRTIAVLGSGLDVVYPKEHQALYEEIAERGALLSEFALGTQPFAENFPKRNRIIAGLSLGALVIEAHSRSGSLITAHLAADEGREVFALPGRIDQLGSRGTHRLIKEGAELVEAPEDILEALGPQLWPLVDLSFPGDSLEGGEEVGFLGLFDKALTVDEAARQGGLPIPSTTALLTRLELKRALRKRPDGRYERI
jgi:DNA processing protein